MIIDHVPAGEYQTGQQVQLLVKTMTDLGYKAIVDGKYWGVLYYNEVFQELEKNQQMIGYIKNIREDGKLDLSLYKTGHLGADGVKQLIIDDLKDAGGFLPITSQTPPEDIYECYGVSKKKFKIALSGLYKSRTIEIREDGIYLLKDSTANAPAR